MFVKAHCRGALIRGRDALLGAPADDMLTHLENEYGSAALRLHYVTLRDMYNII